MEVGGVLFLLLFSVAARLVSQGKWLFRCIDGAGKLFCGIKKLEFLLFLGGNLINFFSHFIDECQCKYAVRFEMKSREVYRVQ